MPRTSKIPVCLLVRVSTDRQDTERQISELRDVADSKGWTIVAECKETVSGAARQEDRHGLQDVLQLAQEGRVKKVLVHEVSRLARKNSTAHQFVEDLEQVGVSLYWHHQRIETLLSNGKRNPAASIMFAVLAEIARNERETIVERIKSGLDEARRKGVRLGRPRGSRLSKDQLLLKHKDIVKLLKAGQSIRHTAKLTDKGVSTVQRVRSLIELPTAS